MSENQKNVAEVGLQFKTNSFEDQFGNHYIGLTYEMGMLSQTLAVQIDMAPAFLRTFVAAFEKQMKETRRLASGIVVTDKMPETFRG